MAKDVLLMKNPDEKIYYYTDFNTFKLILQFGTLRFKESTSSNDKLDTKLVYEHMMKIAEIKVNEEIEPEQKFIFDMLKHTGVESKKHSLVVCFTSKPDSRMLWDAYTMHRKDRESTRYNGVCIEFKKSELISCMKSTKNIFDYIDCKKIIYGYEDMAKDIDNIMNRFSHEVKTLSKDSDQSQNIIPPISLAPLRSEIVLKKCIVIPTIKLIETFDVVAPFYKHEFWSEEDETRALLSIKKLSKKIASLKKHSDDSYCYDLPITKTCISKIILGPEFSNEDINELISINGKIKFDHLYFEHSNGAGVITNR